MNNLLAVLDGSKNELGDGGIVSIVSILFVFAILAIIIGITSVVNYCIQKAQSKSATEPQASQEVSTPAKSVDLNDEDAAVAVLVASIDYRNEVKKDIKVLSVKEIK